MACANGVEPLQLPIRNETWQRKGLSTTSRGNLIGIGSPQQLVAILPSFFWNDTVIHNGQGCNTTALNYTEAKCATTFAGWYDPVMSDTYESKSSSQWNGTDEPNTGYSLFADDLSYAAAGKVEQYPFMFTGPRSNSYTSKLGVGQESTFLARSLELQHIPSKIMGFDIGSRSIDGPRDGEMVIGGFDEALISENDMTTFPILPGCGVCVRVQAIAYEKTSGESVPLIEESFDVRLVPQANGMEAPEAARSLITAAFSSTDVNGDGYPIVTTENISGTLEYTLDNDFKVSIPQYELFDRGRNIADDGRWYVHSNSSTFARIQGITTDRTPELGQPFLSQVYLIVDWEREEFKLGHLSQSKIDGETHTPRIKAICGPNDGDSTTPTDPDSSQASPSSTSSSDSSVGIATESSGPSGGAIAGIVVGAVLGIAVIGFLAWFLLRRRRQRKAAYSPPSELPTAAPFDQNQTERAELHHEEAYKSPSELDSALWSDSGRGHSALMGKKSDGRSPGGTIHELPGQVYR